MALGAGGHLGAGPGRPGPLLRHRRRCAPAARRHGRLACRRGAALALPAAPFPAELAVERSVDAKALVHFEGNRYSVPPELLGQLVTVRARLGELEVGIVSAAGRRVARHRRAPTGAGQTIRAADHAHALERAVLDAFDVGRPCKRKANRPPGAAALAAAAKLRGEDDAEVLIDLGRYAELAGAPR